MCDVDGDSQSRGLTLTITGSRPTIQADNGTSNYQRCPRAVGA